MPFKARIRLLAALAVAAVGLSSGFSYWDASSPGYVVRPGDSLWAIATAHGLTVDQLASANRLDPAAILPIGLHLSIPGTSYQVSATGRPSRSLGRFSFCSHFVADPGPYGELPLGLAGSSSYGELVPIFDYWAYHYGVDPALLKAIAWQESGWHQGVVSPTGAVGISQIEPYTASFISESLVGLPLSVRSSVSDNIRASAAFLAYLSRLEGGNRCATIAAYNEGPLNLQRVGVLPDAQRYVVDVEALVPRFE